MRVGDLFAFCIDNEMLYEPDMYRVYKQNQTTNHFF